MKRSIFAHLFYRWLLILPLLGSVICLGFSSVIEPNLPLAVSNTSLNPSNTFVFGNMEQAAIPHQYMMVEAAEDNIQEDNKENDVESNSIDSALLTITGTASGNNGGSLATKRKTDHHIPAVFPRKYILFQSLKLDC